jgi:DNA polymerase sigma
MFPNARIEVYGSVASGLYLPSSDLDVTVEWKHKHGTLDLPTVAELLQ